MDGPAAQERRLASAAAPLVALALAVVLVFLGLMLAATDGHFVPQVVDLYLVCQYAKVMAEGHPFQYGPGDAPSTGATSLLHTVLLAAAHAVGIRGEALVGFAIALGAGLYVASVLVARRAALLLAGPAEGWLAGLLVALGGPVVWAFLYGADSALVIALALLLFERMIATWSSPRPWGWVVPAALLALTRPEGLPLAVLLAAAWIAREGRRAGRRNLALSLLPVAAGVGVMVLYKAVTGSWVGTSFTDKSLFASYGLAQGLAIFSEYAIDLVRGVLLGFYPSQAPIGFARGWAPYFLPPLGLAAALLGAVRSREESARPVWTWLLASTAVVVLAMPNLFLGFHFQRYVVWTIPPLAVLSAVGLSEACRLVSGGDPAVRRRAFLAGAALWVSLALLATARFAVQYADLAAGVYRRDVLTAHWIVRNLPPGVAIANLATSVEYLTGHRSVNLHGVTTPAFFGNRAAEREAGVLEVLARMDPAERPPYLATTLSALDSYPSMRDLVAGPPLFRTNSFSDEIAIVPMRYDVVEGAADPHAPETAAAVRGLELVDRLNVCDARDEGAHRYVFRSRAGTAPLYGTVRVDTYGEGAGAGPRMADGGRPIFGHESFAVRTRPGRDLLIVLRTAAALDGNLLKVEGPSRLGIEFPEAGLIVSVDGTFAARQTHRTHPGWNEVLVRITGNRITSERTSLEVAGRYASFRYWFFQ
jgi:hypothetical protein